MGKLTNNKITCSFQHLVLVLKDNGFILTVGQMWGLNWTGGDF